MGRGYVVPARNDRLRGRGTRGRRHNPPRSLAAAERASAGWNPVHNPHRAWRHRPRPHCRTRHQPETGLVIARSQPRSRRATNEESTLASADVLTVRADAEAVFTSYVERAKCDRSRARLQLSVPPCSCYTCGVTKRRCGRFASCPRATNSCGGGRYFRRDAAGEHAPLNRERSAAMQDHLMGVRRRMWFPLPAIRRQRSSFSGRS